MTGSAFFSDVHGNVPALQAVLADIEAAGCSRVFFLGDLINGVDPHGCVQLLRTWSATRSISLTCLKGNAEAYLTTPDRVSLPRQAEAWNQEVLALVQWFEDHLTAEDLAWIATLPAALRWTRRALSRSPVTGRRTQSATPPTSTTARHRWGSWRWRRCRSSSMPG